MLQNSITKSVQKKFGRRGQGFRTFISKLQWHLLSTKGFFITRYKYAYSTQSMHSQSQASLHFMIVMCQNYIIPRYLRKIYKYFVLYILALLSPEKFILNKSDLLFQQNDFSLCTVYLSSIVYELQSRVI